MVGSIQKIINRSCIITKGLKIITNSSEDKKFAKVKQIHVMVGKKSKTSKTKKAIGLTEMVLSEQFIAFHFWKKLSL